MSDLSVKWIYVLNGDSAEINVLSYLPANTTENWAFEDSSGKRRLEIYADGTLRVLAGYAWDGCSPKFSVCDILIGTPDGAPNHGTERPKTYFASLFHDALYQFMDDGSPISKPIADRIFLHVLVRDDFAPRHLYYWAVRIFGGMFHKYTKRKRKYNGRRVAIANASHRVPQR